MVTKNSYEVQDLLSRIQEMVPAMVHLGGPAMVHLGGPGITGPISNLWDCEYNGYVGIEVVFDQDPPTAILREFRPGHYQLVALYLPHEEHQHQHNSAVCVVAHTHSKADTYRGGRSEHNNEASPPVWEISDYGCSQWFIPVTTADDALLKAL